jgi:hypothetical protein
MFVTDAVDVPSSILEISRVNYFVELEGGN